MVCPIAADAEKSDPPISRATLPCGPNKIAPGLSHIEFECGVRGATPTIELAQPDAVHLESIFWVAGGAGTKTIITPYPETVKARSGELNERNDFQSVVVIPASRHDETRNARKWTYRCPRVVFPNRIQSIV